MLSKVEKGRLFEIYNGEQLNVLLLDKEISIRNEK